MGQVTPCCNCSTSGHSRSLHLDFVVRTIQLLDKCCHIIYSTTPPHYLWEIREKLWMANIWSCVLVSDIHWQHHAIFLY